MEKLNRNGHVYMLVKANATHVPLLDNSVSLVIGTPPLLGERRICKGEFCTSDPDEYKSLMTRFMAEAIRIEVERLHPGPHAPLTDPYINQCFARDIRYSAKTNPGTPLDT